MRRDYIDRMRIVRDEYAAARQAIAYVCINWHKHDLVNKMDLVSYKDFELAARNLELSYFIRLYAEFEGILKDHLGSHHSHVKVPKNPKVDWLISRVAKCESVKVDPQLQIKINAVRDYRNSIAHKGMQVPVVTFSNALSRLNIFLAKVSN